MWVSSGLVFALVLSLQLEVRNDWRVTGWEACSVAVYVLILVAADKVVRI